MIISHICARVDGGLISGAGVLPRPIAEQEANNEPQEAASSSAYVRPDG